jgi:integrase
VTQNNYRRILSVLWSFALGKGWVADNIIKRIEAQTVVAEPVEILDLEQTRALLCAAKPSILPYLAIALFAGLRDAELKRLDWRAVDFLTGYITVSAKAAKTRRKRMVPIPANLKLWLQPVANATGMVTPSNWRPLLKRARKDAGIEVWPYDATRHSFGTYELARTKDIGHVSEVMGNSPDVVLKHYKEAIRYELGAEYFAIVPELESNVIAMHSAA